MATTPEFLVLPGTTDAWISFVSDEPEAAFAQINQQIAELAQRSALTAPELLAAFNEIEFQLGLMLSRLHLIAESHPAAEVRDAAESAVERGSAIQTDLWLNHELWQVVAEVDARALTGVDLRYYEQIVRDFRRSGVTLPAEQRAEVKQLKDRHTELMIEFSRNIREAKGELRVRPEQLAGLPEDFIADKILDDDGYLTLTTDYPDLIPVRDYAHDRDIRRELSQIAADLAWPQNDPVLAELLNLRQTLATALGYDSWADYETETRMVGSGPGIDEFLTKIDEASLAAAEREYEPLLAELRTTHPQAEHLETSDFWYLLGQLKRDSYGVDAQQVRSYFNFDRVLDGILGLTTELFGLEYTPVDVPRWHEEVLAYDVDLDGKKLGRIYLDLHPRDGKYGHAACFDLVGGLAGRALPEGVLLCNFSRGLLEHDEVLTFLHEFGHLVHAIIGGHQPWSRFSGVATEWDFVEAPSQMLEEWGWDAGVLAKFATNEAGEPIPAELVENMRRADAFGRALEVRRQLGSARVSFNLHADRPADLQAATEDAYRTTSPIQPLPGSHSYANFGHLTGYGACYYTYQWSLVIGRELLSEFGDNLLDQTVAHRYRDLVLAPGGSKDAADLVRDFLGREYGFEQYRAYLTGS